MFNGSQFPICYGCKGHGTVAVTSRYARTPCTMSGEIVASFSLSVCKLCAGHGMNLNVTKIRFPWTVG